MQHLHHGIFQKQIFQFIVEGVECVLQLIMVIMLFEAKENQQTTETPLYTR